MAPTFVHPGFEKYAFEEIPTDEEMFIMDEVWLNEYEQYLVSRFEGGGFKSIGYVSYAAKRSSTESAIQLSWYPNTNTRFHEVVVSLPREMFVACVSCARYDDTLRVFVRSGWFKNLYLRAHSIFALVDAIGVKDALASTTRYASSSKPSGWRIFTCERIQFLHSLTRLASKMLSGAIR
jgi:hypothetical protein